MTEHKSKEIPILINYYCCGIYYNIIIIIIMLIGKCIALFMYMFQKN